MINGLPTYNNNIRDYETSVICHRNYLNLIQDSIATNVKSFWDYAKTKRSNSTGFPKTMSYDGKQSTSIETSSELFAEYFQSVYEEESTSKWNSRDFYNINISTIHVTAADVFKYLDRLNSKKSAGPDLVPAIFLKKCSVSLAYPIAIIFNKSL